MEHHNITQPDGWEGGTTLLCLCNRPQTGPQMIPIETRVTRSDMPLLRANPRFELALIHRSGPRNCATNKERQRGSGAPTMKKKNGAGSSDDTKSISPSHLAATCRFAAAIADQSYEWNVFKPPSLSPPSQQV